MNFQVIKNRLMAILAMVVMVLLFIPVVLFGLSFNYKTTISYRFSVYRIWWGRVIESFIEGW